MWRNPRLYTILHLVSERYLDNKSNLQKSMFCLGPTPLPLWVAGSLPPCGLPQGFFFFKPCFTFPGWERSKIAWFPEHQMRLLITFAQMGEEAPQPTGLNFGNLLSDWSRREDCFSNGKELCYRHLIVWGGRIPEQEGNLQKFFFLIRSGLQKTFRTDGQSPCYIFLSLFLGTMNYCFKNISQKYMFIVKI